MTASVGMPCSAGGTGTGLMPHPMVIRGAEVDALREAVNIRAAALESAAIERAKHRQQGFIEGFETGTLAAGQAFEHLGEAIDAYWNAREGELLDTAIAIAHRVVAELPPEGVLLGIAKRALAEHRHDKRLSVRAAPEVASLLQSAMQNTTSVNGFEIRADVSVPVGSVFLDHSRGQTEIGLLGQFRAMLLQTLDTDPP